MIIILFVQHNVAVLVICARTKYCIMLLYMCVLHMLSLYYVFGITSCIAIIYVMSPLNMWSTSELGLE